MPACFFVLSVTLLVLQGCVAVQSFPTVARAGDTITLAVGSPDGMTKANTTIQFVSNADPANPVNLPIRSLIRIRPDNTSHTALFDGYAGAISYYSSHGPWMSVAVLDLPQGLALGPATINIMTTAVYSIGADVNEIPVRIEILPGTGVTNAFKYNPFGAGIQDGNLSNLEPLRQAVIRPPLINTGWYNKPLSGAVEIKVNVPMQQISNGNPIADSSIRVVADDMVSRNNLAHVQMDWVRNGDEFTVNFISSTAKMGYFQTRFSVVMIASPNYEYVSSPGPSITSVRYFDANGDVISGMPTASDFSVNIE